MLPKKQRLAASDFPPHSSRRARSPLFLIQSQPGPVGQVENRIGVIIGRSVDKRSVVRHRLKRDILRVVGFWPHQGLDILIIPHPAAARVTQEVLQADLVKLSRTIN